MMEFISITLKILVSLAAILGVVVGVFILINPRPPVK
jgi:hypothetical protein